MISTSSAVVSTGDLALAATMNAAMRLAQRSSPYSHKIFSSSASLARANNVLALVVASGSRRMSRTASNLYEKPRSASSSCGLDTPRSKNTLSTTGKERLRRATSKLRKFCRTNRKFGAQISSAASAAATSTSSATTNPCGPTACRNRLV